MPVTFNVPSAGLEQDQVDGGCYYAEASELGLGPGEWPLRIGADLRGRGTVEFVRCDAVWDNGGQFGGYKYESVGGHYGLTVFND